MSDLVIREVKPHVWTFSRPFQRAPFFPFGGRSTAIKLVNGSVWFLASTKADEETLAKLREIGPVEYIIAPDIAHYLHLESYHQAFPSAQVIGVDGHSILPTLSKVTFTGCYGKDPPETSYGFEDEISACYFPGFINKDVAFCHKASKTLIQADLMFNLPPREQYSRSKISPMSWIPLYTSLAPFTRTHRFITSMLVTDTAAAARDAKTVSTWDFDMVIPCHGDVVEGNGKAAWNSVWENYLRLAGNTRAGAVHHQ